MADEPAWVTAWAPTPQPTEEADMPPHPFTARDTAFHNTTIRQFLRVTAGGEHVRIRLSNHYGNSPLEVAGVSIGLPASQDLNSTGGCPAILRDSIQQVLFDGEEEVSVPEGSHVVSDALRFSVTPGQVLSISLYLRSGHPAEEVTSHPGSRTDSWLCHGKHITTPDLAGGDLASVAHWYFLSGVEIRQQSPHHGVLVLLGDSITDGRCSTDNANNRWPDLLFDRMQAHPSARGVAVINQAVGGGRVLRNGKGPSLLRRLDRDALAQPGRRYILVYHGVNDIGTANPDTESLRQVQRALKQAYRQIVSRGHAHGLAVFGATIAPMGGNDPYGDSHLREGARRDVNEWIRTSGAFDGVADFDAVLRCPEDEARLAREFDSGDHLHPNVAAFEAMAEAFPLEFFERFRDGIKTVS
ncbi:hypothetical protein NLU13_1764 [Sarocladium strictum]|uniref:SGNH hydrolase-type esterase domain-containing protein n=1 Tax=Sarocladium strictum TaxID=5046 RepID=A0AA39LCI8_SARSR|nr:hypothetical protein NLU13_1764 [Sarocladium strictum]